MRVLDRQTESKTHKNAIQTDSHESARHTETQTQKSARQTDGLRKVLNIQTEQQDRLPRVLDGQTDRQTDSQEC